MKSGRGTLRVSIGKSIAPPRFLAFLAVLPLAAWLERHFFPTDGWAHAFILGFDCAAAVFLASLVPLLRERGAEAIRRHADANDANRVLVLLVSSLLTTVVLAAIAGELAQVRKGDALAGVELVSTLLLIWLFANSVYALHYAHEFYSSPLDDGGIHFPGAKEPGYGDFAYFAFTLGMTFQTSDVEITSTRMRAVAVLHSFAAFVFNIGVIAFTINVLGGSSG